MEGAQKVEWVKAQEITFSVDLVGAAKQQLCFLEAVDSVGCLYDGPSLERAIYRFNTRRDCVEIYGRVLGKSNVLSTIEGACSKKTESVWNRIYVSEPYNFDIVKSKSPEITNELNTKSQRNIEYDLVAVVKRQSSFFRKVAKMMNYGDCFLDEAVSRYKAFHHLIQIIRQRKLESFCAPTHDIDLI